MFFLIIGAVLISYVIHFIMWKRKYFGNFSSPPGDIFTGHALQIFFLQDEEIFHKVLEFSKYSEIVQIRLLHIVALITTDKKFVQFLLNSDKILSKSFNYGFLHSWLGFGLLTETGSKWRHDRKMLTPAFHFEILKQYVEVFENVGNNFVNNLDKYDSASSFDVCPLTSLCTLDAISEAAMGVKINAQKGENSKYVKCVSDMCDITIQRCLKIYYILNGTYKLSKMYQREKKNLATLHGFTQNVIKEKEQNLKQEKKLSENKEKKLKFLDLMYSFLQKNETIDYKFLQNQVDTFMFAGHDTTSSAVSFTLYCLSNNEEVQKKVYEEQKMLFGDKKSPGITYNDLQNMQYLDLVLKESMRLYPPVPMIGRCADEDLHYGDHIIPKGTNIAIMIYEMHRNPKYFPEPEKFNPERFNNDDIEPFAYLPFSAGLRNCIGQRFAMLEIKSIISKVVRHFQIRPAIPYHQVRVSTKNVLVSLNGIKIRIEKRI